MFLLYVFTRGGVASPFGLEPKPFCPLVGNSLLSILFKLRRYMGADILFHRQPSVVNLAKDSEKETLLFLFKQYYDTEQFQKQHFCFYL